MIVILQPRRACAAVFQPTRIAVTVEGQGPDVIFIPGLASSAHVWDTEAARLKDRYRVHLVQVLGFAGTPAGPNVSGPLLQPVVEEIDAYIRAAGLKRPAVIGHSLGGTAALRLASQHPEDVGEVMLVDALPYVGMIFSPTATVAMVQPQAEAMRAKMLGQTQAEFAAGEPRGMSRMVKSTGAAADAALAAASASDHRVVAEAVYDDMMLDMRPDLAAIRTPVTVLYPFDPDAGMPQSVVDGLYQSAFAPLPNKQLIRIDGARHFIQVDQPEAFDRAVQAFLAR